MDLESVRSGRSERSERSQRSAHSSRHRNKHNGSRSRERGDRSDRESRSGRQSHDDRDTDRDDRSVRIQIPPSNNHHHHHHGGGNGNGGQNHNGRQMNNMPGGGAPPPPPSAPGEELLGGENTERIEVQIINQDDNWGDNTTAITGNTSETGFSMEDMSRITKNMEDSIGFNCARYAGSITAAILAVVAFLSPIAMVILPKVGLPKWQDACQGDCLRCEPECEGLLISIAFKLLILLVGTWALFLRPPRATMPRIFILRALVLFLIFVLTFAYWLFYGVRIYEVPEQKYYSIVQFAASFVDALLFIHYVAVILLELRQMSPQYVVRLTRSPDGESRHYTVGQLSIQRLAVWCLDRYYCDFAPYNPYLEHLPRRAVGQPGTGSGGGGSTKLGNFKFYDVDGVTGATQASRSRAIFAAAARRRDSSHNDRFYEEQEYERRVRKRRARLVVAAEEAFTHIKRLQEEQGPAIPMDPTEAAQAIFPSMARALQKYLRITRQQPRYTMESILEHLSCCISHDMAPKSFLQRYLQPGPVITAERDRRETQTWTLICDQLLSRAVEEGTLFQLRQNEVSLLVDVRRLPHFNLTEEVVDPKLNKFVLRLNSETSV